MRRTGSRRTVCFRARTRRGRAWRCRRHCTVRNEGDSPKGCQQEAVCHTRALCAHEQAHDLRVCIHSSSRRLCHVRTYCTYGYWTHFGYKYAACQRGSVLFIALCVHAQSTHFGGINTRLRLVNKGVSYLCTTTLIICSSFSQFEYTTCQEAVWHLHDFELQFLTHLMLDGV